MAIEEKPRYWTYSIEGNIFDAEYTTASECCDGLEQSYAEQITTECDSINNGDKHEMEATIISFKFNDKNEREIILAEKILVTYEHYHGDLKEHGTF